MIYINIYIYIYILSYVRFTLNILFRSPRPKSAAAVTFFYPKCLASRLNKLC